MGCKALGSQLKMESEQLPDYSIKVGTLTRFRNWLSTCMHDRFQHVWLSQEHWSSFISIRVDQPVLKTVLVGLLIQFAIYILTFKSIYLLNHMFSSHHDA